MDGVYFGVCSELSPFFRFITGPASTEYNYMPVGIRAVHLPSCITFWSFFEREYGIYTRVGPFAFFPRGKESDNKGRAFFSLCKCLSERKRLFRETQKYPKYPSKKNLLQNSPINQWKWIWKWCPISSLPIVCKLWVSCFFFSCASSDPFLLFDREGLSETYIFYLILSTWAWASLPPSFYLFFLPVSISSQ